MTRVDVSFSHVYKKNTHPHKGCDWLTSQKYYGSTSTKKLRLIIIGFNTPTDNGGNKDKDILTIAFLASDIHDEGYSRGLGSGDHHRPPPWLVAMELLRPLPLAMTPRTSSASPAPSPPPPPPQRQSPLHSSSGCCSPPKWMCPGPPCRPSLLRAHQKHKLRIRQCPGPLLLHSGLPPSQSLLSQPPGCAGNATTLASLCRQVE